MLLLFCLELQILEFATTEMENETNVSNLQFTAVYISKAPDSKNKAVCEAYHKRQHTQCHTLYLLITTGMHF